MQRPAETAPRDSFIERETEPMSNNETTCNVCKRPTELGDGLVPDMHDVVLCMGCFAMFQRISARVQTTMNLQRGGHRKIMTAFDPVERAWLKRLALSAEDEGGKET